MGVGSGVGLGTELGTALGASESPGAPVTAGWIGAATSLPPPNRPLTASTMAMTATAAAAAAMAAMRRVRAGSPPLRTSRFFSSSGGV